MTFRSNDSFCVVDDDLSVRSDDRCLLKLSIHNEDGFLHSRMIHLHQVAEAEKPGELSFKLLRNLIQQSSDKPNDEGVISITYEDHEGEEVLIGSSHELQYAINTQGVQDIFKLKAKILQGKTEPKISADKQENIHVQVLEGITQHLTAMEARIHQKISLAVEEVELRLVAKLDTIEQRLATTERVIVSACTVACESNAMEIMEQGRAPPAPVSVPSATGRSLSVAVGKSMSGVLPTAVVEHGTVATAECHWTASTNATNLEAGVDVSSSEVETDTSEDGRFTVPEMQSKTTDVPLSINITGQKEKMKDSSFQTTDSADGVDEESIVDVEQLVSKVLSKEVLPLLNKCLRRLAYYEEKRGRGLSDLKEELQAQSSKMEEWNRTVLDGISVQSTVVKARMNDRADRVVRRISSLEAFCRDLSNKNILLKQGQTIKKIAAEQSGLRNDLKALLQAMVRGSPIEEEDEDGEDCKDDSSSVQSSRSSKSSSESVYTTITVVGEDNEDPIEPEVGLDQKGSI